ncbi:hypothetical protein Tco_0087970 [Tanacetum coccineum]
MLNPSPETCSNYIVILPESTSLVDVPVTTIAETIPLSSATTLPPPSIPLITYLQQTPVPTPTTVLSSSLQDLPNFGSLFGFDHRLKTLETDFSEFKQTNQFVAAVSSIPDIVDMYLANKMNEAIKTAVQLQSDRLRDEAQAKNADFINKLDDNIKKIIKDQVKATSGKEPESTSAPKEKTSKTIGKSTEGYKSHHKSVDKSVRVEEPMHIAEDLEEPAHQEFVTGDTEDKHDEETSQLLDCTLAQKEDTRESFNELMDTPLDFSAFVMNRLKVDTLTPELLAGPTFKLMKGSCKSLIEDLVPDTMWSQVPVSYDKYALLGFSIGGEKQQSYGFAANRESACDVYSKCRIIAVTKLQIIEWHNYKHLDWITVRRDDDKLYKFNEGNFNRLHIQDIVDMLLLLVHREVLTNLTVEECLAFNVSLRMFTRSIVIQRRVEDLQLGVESYQKKLNLTKPDTYRSDLKRREAYTAYSNPRGFIYQNKDKKNKLMRIDELHKFSDGTLNDVRTALNDRLKGIRMKYLPQTIWRQSDRDKAGAMIQAIDKQLKTRRIMRNLEEFLGGRPYEGDFRLLQRTI